MFAHRITRRDFRVELFAKAIEPAETRGRSVAEEANGIPVAVLAVTRAGTELILQIRI